MNFLDALEAEEGAPLEEPLPVADAELDEPAFEWDPAVHERVYYTHGQTGDRGWLVRREGKDCIKYDRSSEDIVRPFRPGEWKQVAEKRPMTRMQLAQVAFAADRQLCLYLGMPEKAKVKWMDLREQQRINWMRVGPRVNDIRITLFESIMEALAPLAE